MARKQRELEGMETQSAIPEIDQAAERLRAASKKRKHAQDAETEAKTILLQLMKDNKLRSYEDHDTNPPLVVIRGETETIKVEEMEDGDVHQVREDDGEEAEDEQDAGEKPKRPLKMLKQQAAKKEAPAEA